jgi:hypothetical protein
MKRHISAIALVTFGVLLATAPATTVLADEDKYRNWQLNRLFNPDERQLTEERKGRVYIYDGLRDSDIRRALDEQFGRLESMMFIGTIITDEEGEPRKDKETGLIMIEADDC